MFDRMVQEKPIVVAAGSAKIQGDLAIPAEARGMVLFAHGSGSSRHSPRNRHVAGILQKAGFGTLLLDLLTEREEVIEDAGGQLRFDVALLAERLLAAADWLAAEPSTGSLPLGVFGASTGAAAAVIAAADRPRRVCAVVSRGGRPDLAADALPRVQAPTLLIVGGEDRVVIDLNEDAAAQMRAEHHIAIVPGATHLFEEPGALDEVAELALSWFVRYLAAVESRAA